MARLVRYDGQLIADIPDHSWDSMFSEDQKQVLMAWAGQQPQPSILRSFAESLGPVLTALVLVVLAEAVALIFIFS